MYIRVRVVPGARREQVFKKTDTEYEMTVKEPAQQNFANRRVKELLAHQLGIKEDRVRLVTGHHSPSKLFDITLN